jgi:nicotinate-nucleotide adenylyltransferase
MKIGLFFGSFNPIHIGHLIIADYFLKYSDLNKIWFVISPHNPFKKKESLLADYHRFAMVNLAIEDNNAFKASDVEFKLPQPSYTINTLNHLHSLYPKHEFALIMGEDNLITFDKWKDYKNILENYKLYVYRRKNYNLQNLSFINNKNIIQIDTPLIEISASVIRQSIKNKKDMRYMLPAKVYDYIKEMHFYEK